VFYQDIQHRTAKRFAEGFELTPTSYRKIPNGQRDASATKHALALDGQMRRWT
jgi:hypothetical protein